MESGENLRQAHGGKEIRGHGSEIQSGSGTSSASQHRPVHSSAAAAEERKASEQAILDAQIGYEFQSGPLANFAILAQAKNLTDRPFVTYQNDDPRQVIDYQRYGRDYYVGITYKF